MNPLPNNTTDRYSPMEHVYFALIGLATAAWVYSVSFHSPIVVDYGTLLERVWRTYKGEMLGRDFDCATTPLTYFIQAIIFKIFSPAVLYQKLYLAAEMGAMTWLSCLFARRVLGFSLKTTLIWVAPLSAAWVPGLHLMIPWYDVDAIFFSFLTLCALGVACKIKTPVDGRWMFAAGLLSGLSYLSKQNIGGGCVIAALCCVVTQPNSLLTKLRHSLLIGLGAVIPVAVTMGYFYQHGAFSEAWEWMFTLAGQRYGKGNLVQAMWESNWLALFGPRNNFLKVIFAFHFLALFFAWKNEKKNGELGPVYKGLCVYALISMWIAVLQESGGRYTNVQNALGILGGILTVTVFDKLRVSWSRLILPAGCMTLMTGILVWGATLPYFRKSYVPKEIRFTVNHPRLKGMYFRQSDSEIVTGLMEFEATIPKNERMFIFPDPIFFYFASDRMSPVPMTYFSTGWELKKGSERHIPEMLEKADVRWILIGREKFFDTGFLQFSLDENWKIALRNGSALTSRGEYPDLRSYIEDRFKEAPGPSGFWTFKKVLTK